MILVGAPAADSGFVNGLAHLRCTRRAHRAIGLVEGKAARVPRQTAISDNAARLSFQIADDVFITNIENTLRGQHPAPVRHQPLVTLVIAAELGEIIGVVLFGGEKFRETGDAGVDGIADRVDDFRVWQGEMDEGRSSSSTASCR